MSRSQLRQLDGSRIREARKAAGLTQEGLARELTVTVRTVQHWEHGTAEPGGAQLLRLAERLGLAPDALYEEAVA